MDDAVSAATEIALIAGEHASEGEQRRRLASPVVDAISASKLGRLIAPTEMGGNAAHPATVVGVVETIARADASAGWCVGIGMGSNYLAGIVARRAAVELYVDLDRMGCGPFAPTGRLTADGEQLRLSGRWSFTSNCQQRGVMACGVIRFEDGQPQLGPHGMPRFELAFLAPDEYDIVETWDTVGMRATGSHDTTAEDVALSPDRVAFLFGPSWPDDPLFRLRTFDVLGACLSPVALGIGRAALDLVLEQAHRADDGRPRPRAGLYSDPILQAEYGRAETRLRAARLLLLDALDDAWSHALRGDTPPREATALIGLANNEAMAAGVQAVDTAARALGTAAVRDGSPLDRLRRDIDTARQHVMFAPTIAGPLARQLAGAFTVQPPYLPPPTP